VTLEKEAIATQDEPDERRCSHDKSRRWNCSHYTGQRKAHLFRRGDGVRNATETPLAQGLALERNLFLKLCISESALARMRSYEEQKITSPSRSIEVETGSPNHE